MIPAPHLIAVRRWHESTDVDAHGNPVAGHGDPEPLPAHGWAPGASRESLEAGRDADEVAWTVYLPAGVSIDARDLVILDGTEYAVNGNSLDWSHGPWGNPVAGIVVELVRKEG